MKVGGYAVVGFDVGSGPRLGVPGVSVNGGNRELAVPILDRLRVIGYEGRACPGCGDECGKTKEEGKKNSHWPEPGTRTHDVLLSENWIKLPP